MNVNVSEEELDLQVNRQLIGQFELADVEDEATQVVNAPFVAGKRPRGVIDEDSSSEEDEDNDDWMTALLMYPEDTQITLCRSYANFLVKKSKARLELKRSRALAGEDLIHFIKECK